MSFQPPFQDEAIVAGRARTIAMIAAAAGPAGLAIGLGRASIMGAIATCVLSSCAAWLIARLLRRDTPEDVRGTLEGFASIAVCTCALAPVMLLCLRDSEVALMGAGFLGFWWGMFLRMLAVIIRQSRIPRSHSSAARAARAAGLWLIVANGLSAPVTHVLTGLDDFPNDSGDLGLLFFCAEVPALVLLGCGVAAIARRRRFIRDVARGRVEGWRLVPIDVVPANERGALLNWDLDAGSHALVREPEATDGYRTSARTQAFARV